MGQTRHRTANAHARKALLSFAEAPQDAALTAHLRPQAHLEPVRLPLVVGQGAAVARRKDVKGGACAALTAAGI